MNTCILNLGVQNMSIERYTSLRPELSNQVREIRIRLRCGKKKKDNKCLKSHLMKTWLKIKKWWKSKGWINVSFLQGWKHNTWVAISGFDQQDLTQNVKINHRKKFHRSLQLSSCCPYTDVSTPLKQKSNLEVCTIYLKVSWFLSILK